LVINASLKAAGCRCIEVGSYPGRGAARSIPISSASAAGLVPAARTSRVGRLGKTSVAGVAIDHCGGAANREAFGGSRPHLGAAYLSWPEILVKTPAIWLPSVLTIAMIATAIPAAISPYSIAVAPDSACRNRRMDVGMAERLSLVALQMEQPKPTTVSGRPDAWLVKD
jgi:hypothetical protein